MAEKTYEPPQIKVLGNVTDLTQKGGPYFDYGHACEGHKGGPVCGPHNAGCS